MKKAFDWLHKKKIPYTFHNYKEEGISAAKIKEWLKHKPITEIINTKSTTFKNLSETDQKKISNTQAAIKLIQENTSMIKRPVLETATGIMLGFNETTWEKELL